MGLKDGKLYKTDELGRLSDLAEAREVIHELTSLNQRLLALPVGGGMPLEFLLMLEHPAMYSLYIQVNAAAHAATCETFDRKIMMETGELVPVDQEHPTEPSTTLPENIQNLLRDISKQLGE